MVIAGPGTGKTQVVAMRIAEILRRTQLGERNILALTFTEAGVSALRTRLETLIGPDAYLVTIATFHGFANEIINTFPYVFGFNSEALNLTELERLQIIHQIVESSSTYNYLRPPRSPTFHVPTVADVIRKCKQEAIEPERLAQLSKSRLRAIKRRSLSESVRKNEEKTIAINLELSDIYRRYQKILVTRHLYDYEDMILFALQGLKDHPEVRLYYQERYQYILVDEYQDTNNSQNALVETLADFFPNPNLFVVGDDKQAIYRFQGASVANMLHFAKKYPQIKIISLKENYRNCQPIIEAATDLIKQNTHQLSTYFPNQPSDLTATRDSRRSRLERREFIDQDLNFSWIVQEINKLQRSGVKLEGIAVLFRRNDSVRSFRRIALKFNLPIAGTEAANLINEPDVQSLLALLDAVNDPSDQYNVAATLRLIYPISIFTLAHLARVMREERLPITKAIKRLKLEKKEITDLKRALDSLRRWAELSRQESAGETIETVLGESRILQEVGKSAKAIERLEILRSFVDQVRRFTAGRPGEGLADFLAHVGLLRQYRVQLPIRRLSPLTTGVFVSTVHGAKGLEFETVFLPDLSDRLWNDRGPRELIKLPSEVVELTDWQESPLEEERRLLYVALTRARNRLYLGYTNQDDNGNPVLPSQFLVEIKDHFPLQKTQISSQKIKKILTTALSPTPTQIIRDREKTYLRETIASTPFSYTDYQAFKICPQQYLLSRVLRYPTSPNLNLTYGAIIHRALELFFKAYRMTKNRPGPEILQRYFDQAVDSSWPVKGKERLKIRGKALLTAYYRRFHQSWLMPVGVEYDLASHHILLEDIWLTGKFDRIDPLDPIARTVRIVDYKTGSQAKSRGMIEGTTKDGDDSLKRQLIFYAMLGSLDRYFPWRLGELELNFIDDKQTFRQEIFQIEREEIQAMKKDVIATYGQIVNLEVFEHTRAEFDRGCQVCQLFAQLR